MSNWTKWVGLGLLALGVIVGAQYVRASVRNHAPTTATVAIAPEELTAKAGALPITQIDSYF